MPFMSNETVRKHAAQLPEGWGLLPEGSSVLRRFFAYSFPPSHLRHGCACLLSPDLRV